VDDGVVGADSWWEKKSQGKKVPEKCLKEKKSLGKTSLFSKGNNTR